MENLDQQSTVKKARLELPVDEVSQNGPQVEATGGASGPVAVKAAAAWGELVVRIDKAKLHCPRCDHPFKPPIYQFLVRMLQRHRHQLNR